MNGVLDTVRCFGQHSKSTQWLKKPFYVSDHVNITDRIRIMDGIYNQHGTTR